jgi:hypothetical protein
VIPISNSASSTSCRRCSAELAPGTLVCKSCHTLVHADTLEQLAAGAKMLEDQGDLVRAREEWLKGVPLLPADSRQTVWIEEQARKLEAAASAHSSSGRAKKSLGRLAPLAPLLILLSKGKAIVALLNMKFLLSLGAFIGFYWSLYGMVFGAGFAAQILIHELGHYIDIKRGDCRRTCPCFCLEWAPTFAGRRSEFLPRRVPP